VREGKTQKNKNSSQSNDTASDKKKQIFRMYFCDRNIAIIFFFSTALRCDKTHPTLCSVIMS
jgi:hypothetical protein